jgi:hypothetical protein
MRRDRDSSRWSAIQWSRRRSTMASTAAFSQPDNDVASAMPTWARWVP